MKAVILAGGLGKRLRPLTNKKPKPMMPLGGKPILEHLMKWIKKNNFSYSWVATFPCDTPFFNISIIDEFTKAAKLNDSCLYFAKTKEKRHYQSGGEVLRR